MAEWKFGKKRVELDAEKYGLDENGWIEVRTRVTAEDWEQWVKGALLMALAPRFILNWQIKVDGEEVPCDPEARSNAPVEILTAVIEVLETTPLVAKALGLATIRNGSTGTTPESAPATEPQA